MKIYLCLAASLLVSGCDFSTSTALTQSNLNEIHNDMSPAEVRLILGDPSDSQSEAIPIVGGIETIYTYRSGSSEVTIIFKNDFVREKRGTFSQ